MDWKRWLGGGSDRRKILRLYVVMLVLFLGCAGEERMGSYLSTCVREGGRDYSGLRILRVGADSIRVGYPTDFLGLPYPTGSALPVSVFEEPYVVRY